jgi:hypothetical protein
MLCPPAASRFVPEPDSCIATNKSLDHLVGESDQRRRNPEAERFCGCEIDHETLAIGLAD